MRKLYRKSAVHPTPSAVYDRLLRLLPATMFALASGLSVADREVLAYLICCSSADSGAGQRPADHPSSFNCDCFRCYMSYWVKWDSSPDSLVIHQIIDAYEENLSKRDNGKERPRWKILNEVAIVPGEVENVVAVEANNETSSGDVAAVELEEVSDKGEMYKGPVRKFLSFLGAKIWG